MYTDENIVLLLSVTIVLSTAPRLVLMMITPLAASEP